tara:strand:+ start:78 stop:326 length:249 start_codon:yes stop_codon:yes gene_type:complete
MTYSKYDAVSEKLNDVAMDGFAEEEYGSCQEEGFWSALIITDDLLGIIIEDDRGFIVYETFKTEQDARTKWKDIKDIWDKGV